MADKAREEERKKRDASEIIVASSPQMRYRYTLHIIVCKLRREIAADEKVVTGSSNSVSYRWLTENKFRPVSNSTDPRAITSPMFRIGRRGNPGCECKTKASHYEIKPPATRSVHSKINRNRFPSFSPILGEKSIALPIVIGVRRLENSRE